MVKTSEEVFYDVEYHLAPGLIVRVEKVSEKEFLASKVLLENPDGVIHVGGRDGKRVQLIPVRSVLAVNAKIHE